MLDMNIQEHWAQVMWERFVLSLDVSVNQKQFQNLKIKNKA